MTNVVCRKYSAVTPGGMSKDTAGASLSKFPALGKGGKKATTLYLMPTLMARLSRKLSGEKVSLKSLGRGEKKDED